MAPLLWKRCPCVARPACRPSAAIGTMSAPNRATSPCAGRTNLTVVWPSANW
ncbi:Uncharacterised protein [Bordetella pertussis]|nr:Uncharacterised protein [Bordetella pertussis]CFW39701.1 Uncharacterised protein [Bordetella pertussis]